MHHVVLTFNVDHLVRLFCPAISPSDCFVCHFVYRPFQAVKLWESASSSASFPDHCIVHDELRLLSFFLLPRLFLLWYQLHLACQKSVSLTANSSFFARPTIQFASSALQLLHSIISATVASLIWAKAALDGVTGSGQAVQSWESIATAEVASAVCNTDAVDKGWTVSSLSAGEGQATERNLELANTERVHLFSRNRGYFRWTRYDPRGCLIHPYSHHVRSVYDLVRHYGYFLSAFNSF